MSVMTVKGPVAVDELGIMLPHEHLLIDLRNQFSEFSDPVKRARSRERVNLQNLGWLRRNPYALLDNLLLDDLETTAAEINHFKNGGGRTIVDCTSIGINRDVEKLVLLAEMTDVHIIAGSGYYTHDTHPSEMGKWTAEEIAERIVKDITVGIDDTNICAGVIGEIGTSEPVHSDEEKNLLAAALAYRETRVPVYIHTYPWGTSAVRIIDLLVEHGVDPQKIVVCHLDVEPKKEYVQKVLETGVYVEFDNFGKEFYIDPAERGFAGSNFIRDINRIELVKQIISWNYSKQVLLTNDICLKMMLHAYGGWGYDHILTNIVPMMRHEGVPDRIIDQLLKENPKQLFS
jgi:phosphotriesterase-related protein